MGAIVTKPLPSSLDGSGPGHHDLPMTNNDMTTAPTHICHIPASKKGR